MAAVREVPRSARHLLNSPSIWKLCAASFRRCASTNANSTNEPAPVLPDIENESGLMTPILDRKEITILDPRKRASRRTHELPHERFRYHAPKYDRGPLHPVQRLPQSDPTARDFSPGPFNFPRLKQTFHSTIAPDLMTLAYHHVIPGTPEKPERVRLREWDESSPYMKNRPKRGPRGAEVLFPLEKDITFRNVPEIFAVHINMYVPKAKKNSDHLRVARAVAQIISGVRPEVTETKTSVAQWGIVKGDRTGIKCSMFGNQAYEFVDKVIHLVLPKIKEWPGIAGTSGDGAGNIGFGLEPTDLMYFPEVEANYSMYPAKMVPGVHIKIETTARSDRQARLLLQSMGLPFYGKLID